MRHAPLSTVALALALALGACAVDDRSLLGSEPVAGSAPSSEAGTEAGEAGTEAAPAVPNDCPDLDNDSIADCEQTLVKNPAFETDDFGWIAEANVVQAWSSTDARQLADSGSVRIESTLMSDLDKLNLAGSRQCLTGINPATYDLYAQLFIPRGQHTAGTAGLDVIFYTTLDCTGDILDERGSDRGGETDAWQVIHLQVKTPEGAHSLSVRLMTVKAFSAAPFAAVFDNVLVKAQAN